MKIGLHDAERDHMPKKSFPNFALMKIAAYHKARGDSVEWWDYRKNCEYDAIYSSKVFDFTPENPKLPPNTRKGGTGYGLYHELPAEIDAGVPDYSIYPDCDYAIGFITRGCPNICRFCVVPLKEGEIRPYADWRGIVRPDTKKLVLMDNNILACDYGIAQLAELSETDYRLDLNQGMDARLFTECVADICARIKWIRFLRFSCDSMAQVEAVENAVNLLKARKIKPYRVFIYLLVTADLQDAAERVEILKRHRGINLICTSRAQRAKGYFSKSRTARIFAKICIQRRISQGNMAGILPSKKHRELFNRRLIMMLNFMPSTQAAFFIGGEKIVGANLQLGRKFARTD